MVSHAMKYSTLFVFFLPGILCMILSCKDPTPSSDTDPQPAKVYIVGDSSGSGMIRPRMWQDGFLQPSGLDSALYPRSVFLSGNDVYVTGLGFSGILSPLLPRYWKNGIGSVLPHPPGAEQSRAEDIFVANGNVHIVGSATIFDFISIQTIPSYWKNEISTPLLLPGPFTDDYSAVAVFVAGTDVYIAGSWRTDIDEKAIYWVNEIPVVLSGTPGYDYAVANDIAVVGTDVYVVGYQTPGFPYRSEYAGTLWKNGVPIILSGPEDQHGVELRSVFVSGNDVYAAGSELISHGTSDAKIVPVYWKNNIPVSLAVFSTEGDYHVSSIFVDGTDVHAVGSVTIQNGFNPTSAAVYWKNDAVFKLQGGTSATSIFVRN